ncbi:MAG: cyclic nucleotide-binding and patatin-like phospholipase domain-containing protein [Dehalococcoidia bacterium]
MNDSTPIGSDFWRVASSVELFAGIDPTGRALLAASARSRLYRAGDLVAGVGVAIESIYIVEAGLLGVAIPDQRGDAIEVARLGPGDYCGELSLIRHEHSGARVEALDDAVVWEVPHAVLAEIAEHSPHMMRELASKIASRLSDTNNRLRRMHARGRMVGAVSFGDPGWAAVLLARTALSASRMLSRPVLCVDLTAASSVPTFAHELPSLTDLFSQPGQFAVHDAFATGADARVGVVRHGSGPELSRTAVIDLLHELAVRYPLVVAHVPMTSLVRTSLVAVADTTIAVGFENELDVVRRSRFPAERDVVVLSLSDTPDNEGERQRLSELCRARVLRVVPGGPLPLVRNADGTGEPWQSIDWLGRHFLQRKVGLALGAGGAKGYAHLGVLAALDEIGIPVDYLAGTSIGAPLATGAALGMSVQDMRAHMDGIFRVLAKPRLPWSSVWSAASLRGGLQRLSHGRTFETLRLPLAIVAADLDRREEYTFRSGQLTDAILASIAIPAVYPPVMHDGRRLVDGAVLNPVPTNTVAASGADIVLGVMLSPPALRTERRSGWRARISPPIVETVMRAFDVMQWKITSEGASRADVSIEPVFHGATGLRDWHRADEFIEAGRIAVELALPRLRARFALVEPPDVGIVAA